MFKLLLESKASLNGVCATSVSGDYNTITKNDFDGIQPLLQTPNCWKTIYNLLELYGTMPETKTVQRTSMSNEAHDGKYGVKKTPVGGFMRQDTRNEEDDGTSAPTPLPQHRELVGRFIKVFYFLFKSFLHCIYDLQKPYHKKRRA